jgi:hypothetical protein
MKNYLSAVLAKIGDDYKEHIQDDSRYYVEVSIALTAAELGFPEVERGYRNVCAIVPLKQPLKGMKVRVDGRTFVNYAQFESGVVVAHYVARRVDLPHRAYIAQDSMVCNFA